MISSSSASSPPLAHLFKAILLDKFARNVTIIFIALLCFTIGLLFKGLTTLYRHSTLYFTLAVAFVLSARTIWSSKRKADEIRRAREAFGEEHATSGEFVQLLRAETRMMMLCGTGTVALYDLVGSDDKNNNKKTSQEDQIKQVVDYFNARLEKVVDQNFWMNARLRTDPQTLQPSMWIPPRAAVGKGKRFQGVHLRVIEVDSEEEFLVVNSSSENNNNNTNEKGEKEKKLRKDCLVPSGNELLDKPDAPTFKFTLLWTRASQRFAIIYCLSHVVGDGGTRNAIWGMLSDDETSITNKNKIRPLQYQRAHDLWGIYNLETDANLRKYFWFFVSGLHGFVQGVVLRKLSVLLGADHDEKYFASIITRQNNRDMRCTEFFRIKPEWIAQEKKRAEARAAEQQQQQEQEQEREQQRDKKGADNNNDDQSDKSVQRKGAKKNIIVSTNDLLLHWFSVKQHHTVAACNVLVNLRGIKAGITADHAGNYVNPLVLFQEQLQDPLEIRRVVGSLGHYDSPSKTDREKLCAAPPPRIGGRRVIISSNQVKNFTEAALPGCESVMQFPVTMMGTETPDLLYPMFIVFQMNKKGDLGMLCMTHGPLKDKGPCGERVPYTTPFCSTPSS